MKKTFTYLLTLFIFCACSSGELQVPEQAEDEADIFFFPPAAEEYPTNQETSIEEKIETVDILVFSDGVFSYYRPAWLAGEQYKSTLKIAENVMLWFFINSRERITDTLKDGKEHTDKTPEAILELLIDGNPDRFTGGKTPLPMWGVKKKVDISNKKINDIGTVSLLRSIASVNVEIEKSVSGFKLSTATLFYAASHSYLAPSWTKYTGMEEIFAEPFVPGPATFDVELRYNGKVENNKIESGLYLYENDNRIRPTRLIIGGYYGDDENLTYYPLDFREDSRLIPVLRNHTYEFTIVSVSGAGYTDEQEALKATAVNMDYQVITWDRIEDKDIGIDGPWYLSIGNKQAYIYNRVGSYCRIPVSTNIPIANISTGFINESEDKHFKVEWISKNNELTHMKIIAMQKYSSQYNLDTLQIKAGRIRTHIIVKQLSEDDTDWEEGDDFIVEDGNVIVDNK